MISCPQTKENNSTPDTQNPSKPSRDDNEAGCCDPAQQLVNILGPAWVELSQLARDGTDGRRSGKGTDLLAILSTSLPRVLSRLTPLPVRWWPFHPVCAHTACNNPQISGYEALHGSDPRSHIAVSSSVLTEGETMQIEGTLTQNQRSSTRFFLGLSDPGARVFED